MFQESLTKTDVSIYAYLLVEATTMDILDANQLARTFYKSGNAYSNIEKLFSTADGENSIVEIIATLGENDSIVLENVQSSKITEESFYCNIEICKVDKNLLFFVIKEILAYQDGQIEEVVQVINNPVFVLEHDKKLSLSYGNDKYFSTVTVGEVDDKNKCGLSFLDLLQEDKRRLFIERLNQDIDRYGECNVDIEIAFSEEYCQFFNFSAYKSILDNKLYGALITAKKQSELMKKIEYDQQYFDIMQKFSKDLLFRIDIKKRTLVHRGDISNLVGLLPEMECFPECMREIDLIHPDDLEGYISFVYLMMSGAEASFEPRFHFNNGNYEKYRLQGSPLFDADGNTIQVVGKCENIQKIVDIEAKANYDALTTALNKQSFKELVEDSLKRAVQRDRFALLFLDFDDFKGVNDTMGHAFGDFLLEAAGKRIMNCIRRQDRLGRVGGDEFVIFFQFAPSPEAVLERADAILHSLRREFAYEDKTRKTRASIGISIFPDHGDTYDVLYNKADKALYKSKAKGKDVATVYDESLED